MIPDFDHHPAGSELDWLVLHHGLNWKHGYPALGMANYRDAEGHGADALWPVSTEWAAAERVIAALEARGLRFEVGPDRVRISGEAGTVEASAETQPLALARAVMKAVVAVMIAKR